MDQVVLSRPLAAGPGERPMFLFVMRLRWRGGKEFQGCRGNWNSIRLAVSAVKEATTPHATRWGFRENQLNVPRESGGDGTKKPK